MKYIDGLQCGRYTPEILREMVGNGVTAMTITTAFWEDALETMDLVADWNKMAQDHPDLLVLPQTADDIDRAEREGKIAIVLGAQNSTPFNDRIGFVEHFYRMGMRVIQLTYNNQNMYGGSCYEPEDSGISRGGREIVSEMNRVGMLVDLSHVGGRTTLDTILHSEQPVAITHSAPMSLYNHPRNKTDEVLKVLAERGGVVGLPVYNNITGEYCSSVEKWVEMMAWTVDLIGVEHVGIGTDLSTNAPKSMTPWMRDGRWNRLSRQEGAALSNLPKPPQAWWTGSKEFAELEEALRVTGRFSEQEIALLMGENWNNLYRKVWK